MIKEDLVGQMSHSQAAIPLDSPTSLWPGSKTLERSLQSIFMTSRAFEVKANFIVSLFKTDEEVKVDWLVPTARNWSNRLMGKTLRGLDHVDSVSGQPYWLPLGVTSCVLQSGVILKMVKIGQTAYFAQRLDGNDLVYYTKYRIISPISYN